MKKTLTSLLLVFMLITPVFTIPRLPTIPNISGSVKIPAAVQEAVKRESAEAVKNLKIDWSKFSFSFLK